VRPRGRIVAAAAALTVLATSACSLFDDGPKPEDTARAFLDAVTQPQRRGSPTIRLPPGPASTRSGPAWPRRPAR
jgi:hypothetical protein